MKAGERVMLFQVGSRLYGIGISAVRKVVTDQFITPIPRVPEKVAGAILFEGQAVPVFYTEAPAATRNAGGLILTLQHESNLMGVAIDNVLRVIEPEEGELKGETRRGSFEGRPFDLVTPAELIPAGIVGSGGG